MVGAYQRHLFLILDLHVFTRGHRGSQMASFSGLQRAAQADV